MPGFSCGCFSEENGDPGLIESTQAFKTAEAACDLWQIEHTSGKSELK
jgi:hypothetical protein